MSNSNDHSVLICRQCQGGRVARDLVARLRDAVPTGFRVAQGDCMAGCTRPVTVGFQAPGKAWYLFGDIADDTDLQALAQFAHQYQCSPDGWSNATQRPRALLHKTLARLPALTPAEAP